MGPSFESCVRSLPSHKAFSTSAFSKAVASASASQTGAEALVSSSSQEAALLCVCAVASTCEYGADLASRLQEAVEAKIAPDFLERCSFDAQRGERPESLCAKSEAKSRTGLWLRCWLSREGKWGSVRRRSVVEFARRGRAAVAASLLDSRQQRLFKSSETKLAKAAAGKTQRRSLCFRRRASSGPPDGDASLGSTFDASTVSLRFKQSRRGQARQAALGRLREGTSAAFRLAQPGWLAESESESASMHVCRLSSTATAKPC